MRSSGTQASGSRDDAFTFPQQQAQGRAPLAVLAMPSALTGERGDRDAHTELETAREECRVDGELTPPEE